MMLDIISEHAHLLVQVAVEIEAVELTQSQLTVIIVETLLGNPEHFGRVLKVQPFSECGLAVQMQVAPSLDQFYCFGDGAFLTFALFSFRTAIMVDTRIHTIALES